MLTTAGVVYLFMTVVVSYSLAQCCCCCCCCLWA